MIDPKTNTANLQFIKRALLSHLMSVTQLINAPESVIFTGIDLNREYTIATNLLDDIETLLSRRTD